MELQIEGIIFWALAWISVISLGVYCYGRLLKPSNKKGEQRTE